MEGTVMFLYLVQHAETKSKDEDTERHLSDKGIADIVKVATFVAKHVTLKVDSIGHSGKARARQTAEILAKHLNPPTGVSAADGLEPLADPSVWTKRLADEKEDLMLVGHLPHLDKLAAKLICQDENKSVVAFQMGGIVCLERGDSGDWRVRWMVTPKMLK
jgi:phosphohistidine phosphatase